MKNDKTFQLSIIKRFMTAEQFDDFEAKYNAARKPSGVRGNGEILAPTAAELQMAAVVKELGYSKAAKELRVKTKDVYAATSKVARYEFLKG